MTQEKVRTRFTMVHDRFQAVCLNGCGHIEAFSKLNDAIHSAKNHHCVSVVVYDNMTRKNIHANRYERTLHENGMTSEAYMRMPAKKAVA